MFIVTEYAALKRKLNGEQEKEYMCEGGREKSVPCDHRLSSIGKPHDDKW